jgi:hypothetical protein
MENCSPLFASIRDVSAAFALFELFAIVLSIYNEHLNSSQKVTRESSTRQGRRCTLAS